MSSDHCRFESLKFLTEAVDIVHEISKTVTLKKRGQSFLGLCPFHHEKTPSFSVSQERRFFYCFGCHAKGDVIAFVMRQHNLSFIAAVEKLASEYNIKLSDYSTTQTTKSTHQIAAHKALRSLVLASKQDLENSPTALHYCQTRKLCSAARSNYHIGYSGPAFQMMLSKLIKSEPDVIKDQGLMVRNRSRFHDRLLFPIQNNEGKVIAFGSRSLTADAKPKYVNSPETPLFKKRDVIYGIYQFKKAESTEMIIVEGYMDVLSLYTYGLQNCVACMGTAFTQSHWKTIKYYAKHFIFCFDGDRAGRQASWQSLNVLLAHITPLSKVSYLLLPDDHDPDSFVRAHGIEAFNALIKHATPWDAYFFQTLSEHHDITLPMGRASYMEEAKKLIETIKNDSIKQIMTHEIYKHLNIHKEATPSPKQQAPSARPYRIKQQNERERTRIAYQLINSLSQKESTIETELTHIENPDDNPLLTLLNLWIQHLISHPRTSGKTLISLINGTPLFETFSTTPDEKTNYPPRILIAKLRIYAIQDLINNMMVTCETLGEEERKKLKELIAQKNQLQSISTQPI